MLRRTAFFLFALLGGCAARPLAPCPTTVAPALSVQVLDHGWHTDLALPASGLAGPLARFRDIYPGLRVLVVGFGKRSFMTAPARGIADYLLGPLPSDGVLLVSGLRAAPALAWADGTAATIALTPAERDRLDAFVWRSFSPDGQGRPVPVGAPPFPGGRFYAARLGYSGVHTCNTWTVEALRAAGLPVSPFGVVLAGQSMARAGALGPECRIAARS